ncbi:MAG TPA: pirin family protein [bacterium]|nr:pirin family protein [bacterium]
MIQIRKSADRGHFDHGWLETYHTFSFADYHDSKWMGFRTLRVINEDFVQPGEGFPTHAHRDMEIVTYVLEGALQHKDSMGNGSVIVPGEVQRMSAGKGVTHSEYNRSKVDAVHLLQIWILTEKKGIEPGYEQRAFGDEEKRGRLRLIASRDGREGSVTIHQDTDLFATILGQGGKVEHPLKAGRHAWVQVARGEAVVNGYKLEQGDGAALSEETSVEIVGRRDSEVLVFDLP